MSEPPRRRQVIDPAVAALLRHQDEKQSEAHLPKDERRKKNREREKLRSLLPNRVTYDLPEGMKNHIAKIAETQKTSASQVAAILLTYGLEALEQGSIDLSSYRVPSRSPRYEWNLDLGRQKGR